MYSCTHGVGSGGSIAWRAKFAQLGPCALVLLGGRGVMRAQGHRHATSGRIRSHSTIMHQPPVWTGLHLGNISSLRQTPIASRTASGSYPHLPDRKLTLPPM